MKRRLKPKFVFAIIILIVASFSTFIVFCDSCYFLQNRLGPEYDYSIYEVEYSNSGDLNVNDKPINNPVGEDTGTGVDGGSGGTGGGGSSSSGSSGESEINISEVDFGSVPCGSYFKQYAVCAGNCSEGECVNEGRSCYCKIDE